MNKEKKLESIYKNRFNGVLLTLEERLESNLKLLFKNRRIDSIVVRAKSPESFMKKAHKLKDGNLKYSDPIHQIYDQVGARIVTFYLSDVESLAQTVTEYFGPVEEKNIIPESLKEFGYEAKHFILLFPKDLCTPDLPEDQRPRFFELQIATLFQHAWAQANHDLAYKPPSELTRDQNRMVAFTAAQAWGADMIFNDLVSELTKSKPVQIA